jgi:pyruvate,water dikinase
MSKYVLWLDEITSEHAPLVGGKGLRLAELVRAGLSVPPGFVVTTDAYWAFLDAHGLAESTSSLQQLIQEHPVPDDLARAITEACRRLDPAGGGFTVAVRSSATVEDLAGASFAGQYDTYLNVSGPEQVIERVRDCWASLWSERAVSYRQKRGEELADLAMAVVVQQQVPADVSGVLFTLNPMTGREEEMAVEAAWGLGEAVVSGRVTPDHFVLDVYQERVVKRDVARKTVMVVPAPEGGVQEVPVPPERQDRPTLTDAQLLELMELGFQVQAIYGYPQDIEWCLHDGRFYVLQTRPLTSYTFAPDIGQWTSANFREALPGFVSPLSASLSLVYDYGHSLAEFFYRMKMAKEPPLDVEWGRLFFGRVYWNIGEVKRYAAVIPGYKERVLDRTVGIEPTYDGDGVVTPWTPRTVLRALPVLFALDRLYKECIEEAEAFKRDFLKREKEYSRVDPAALSDAELCEWVRRMIDLHWEGNRIAHTVSILSTQAQDDFHPMVEKLNQANPDQEPVTEGRLLTGLTDMSTARPMIELWELSREARKDPQVAQVILDSAPEEMLDRLQGSQAGREFWERLQAFIQKYRYMSPIDEDLSLPRWDEDPSFVLTTLKAYVRQPDDKGPEQQVAEQVQVRLREEERARALLSRGLLNRLIPYRRRQFFNQLRLVQRYCWWREETRTLVSMAFYHCRRFFVELGRRWAASGYLEHPDDVFCLTREQVLDAMDGKLSGQEARDAVRKYKRMKLCYRNFEPPHTIGRGFRLPEREPATVTRLEGVPCSGGTVVAPARVILSLNQAHELQKGEVLVAPYTNPGWTPLFHLAGGIVMEEGGLLSHGAVVAREFGIPAVIRVERATRLLRTGQTVRVDGTKGTVEILNGHS